MKPFVFVHIPKCGGSSIRHAIRLSAEKSGVKSEQILDGWFQPTVDQIKGKRVVSSHITWSEYLEAEFVDAVTFTMLRDPVDRAISLYYYQAKRMLEGRPDAVKNWERRLSKEHLEDMNMWKSVPSMDDCPAHIMDSFIGSLSNMFVYHLSVDWVWPHKDTVKPACERLREFTGVGILEKMPETQRLVNKIAPFNAPVEIGHANRSNNQGASQRLRDRMKEMLEIDIAIYDFAVELLEEASSD